GDEDSRGRGAADPVARRRGHALRGARAVALPHERRAGGRLGGGRVRKGHVRAPRAGRGDGRDRAGQDRERRRKAHGHRHGAHPAGPDRAHAGLARRLEPPRHRCRARHVLDGPPDGGPHARHGLARRDRAPAQRPARRGGKDVLPAHDPPPPGRRPDGRGGHAGDRPPRGGEPRRGHRRLPAGRDRADEGDARRARGRSPVGLPRGRTHAL
ncbi:MAG: putative secreted protein, partial [uncultured Rubrobacteraceae bacterium]